MNCKNCSYPLEENNPICTRCEFNNAVTFAPVQNHISPTKKKKSKAKLITIISIAGVVAIGGGATAAVMLSQPSVETKVEEQISLGEKYLTQEKYDEAIIAYKKAIEIQPNNPDLYIKLADVYIKKSDNDSAVDTLENGYKKTNSDKIKQKLDDLKLEMQYKQLVTDGNSALSSKNYDKAVENFNGAIKIKPNEVQNYISSADGYIGKNDLDNAKKVLENGYNTTKSKNIQKKIDDLEEKLKNPYLDTVSELIKKYGEPQIETGNDIVNIKGLCYAELIDFDKDGNDELLTAYGSYSTNGYYIYNVN